MLTYYILCLSLLLTISIGQLPSATWSIELAQNSTNILPKFGLRQLSGRCKWARKTNSITVQFYNQQNFTNDYVEMSVYFSANANNNVPFHSENVSVIYKHFANGEMLQQFADIKVFILAVIEGHSLTITERNGEKIKIMLLEDPLTDKIKASRPWMDKIIYLQQILKVIICIKIFGVWWNRQRTSFILLCLLIGWQAQIPIILYSNQQQSVLFMFVHWTLISSLLTMILIQKYDQFEIESKNKQLDLTQYFQFQCLACPCVWLVGYIFKYQFTIILFSFLPLVLIAEKCSKKHKEQTNNIYLLLLYWINLTLCFYPLGCPINMMKNPVNFYLCKFIMAVSVILTVVFFLQQKIGHKINLKNPFTQKQQSQASSNKQYINPAGEMTQLQLSDE